MAITVDRKDTRYATLAKSRNLRWPAKPSDAVGRIELCDNAAAAANALQHAVQEGKRPTVRSGGHCYEDFVVNNPGGVLIDLSILTEPWNERERYRINAGKPLGEVYQELYKRFGLTVPAGTCYTVGAGGHISGGGYGLLSRLHGLTVDWVSGIEMFTVDSRGKVVAWVVDRNTAPDLFRACRGAGGGSFGLITGFLFDKLPPAPKEVATGGISFDWATMTEDRFVEILSIYGNYFETRGKDADTWGFYTDLGLSHSSAREFGIAFQFCNPDGTCNDLSIPNEFLNRFDSCKPSKTMPDLPGDNKVRRQTKGEPCKGGHDMQRSLWLDATIRSGGGGRRQRGKYKSAYMKKNFSTAEAKCIYKHLKRRVPGADLSGSVLAVGSYGGAINQARLRDETACWQRSSIMKLQYQSYWTDAQQDKAHLQWLAEFFNDVYSATDVPAPFRSTPYPGDRYEGCYINYPDQDMLAHSFWPQLYYGPEFYPFLQAVKKKYDPNNIFHHAMSVRV